MKSSILCWALAAAFEWAIGLNTACGWTAPQSLDVLAQQIVSQNQGESAATIEKLRSAGPAGLEALIKTYGDTIQRHLVKAQALGSEEEQANWKRVKQALDGVSGQCDGYASQLYWFTDLNKAEAEAKAQGKPILSLRLLGNLNEEYSCANSRFFRTTLYPQAEVSKYLREHFILHWQTVRPVPKITIDFGDGRKIERTITGNSVHYVLDSVGQPIDALPGLYGPKAFLKVLAEAEHAARVYAGLNDPQKYEYLREYHRRGRALIAKEYGEDLTRIGGSNTASLKAEEVVRKTAAPSALAAGRLAVSKSAIESPMLKSMQTKSSGGISIPSLEADDVLWAKIAALHAEDAQLDEVVWSVVFNKSSTALEAGQRAFAKRLVEDPFMTTWRNLQRSIAEDTVRNEYLLHAQIHDWFVQGIAPRELAGLNAKVYYELFLMPESDPWLGLAPRNTFAGLPNDGLVQDSGRNDQAGPE